MHFTLIRRTVSDLNTDARRLPILDLGKRVYKRRSQHEIGTLATAFGYFWAFAIPSLLIVLAMTAALINGLTKAPVVERLQEMITTRAPEELQEVLLQMLDRAVAQVNPNVATTGVILTLVLALWAASSAIAILILGFNRAFDVIETRTFLLKKIVALGLTLVLVVSVNLAIILLLFGERIGEWAVARFDLQSGFQTLWEILRWPVPIAGMMVVLSVLYWAGPNVRRPFRYVTIGSIIATLCWLVLVWAFGLFLGHFDPGSAYGIAGSLIVLLAFLNYSGMVFFLGAEIDAVLWQAKNGEEQFWLMD